MHRGTGFVIALCDSSVPGKDDGFLDDETLTWLDSELDRTPSGVPVLVGFHHPPALLHSPFIDGIRQFGEPPALAFHVLDDEGRLTTHYRCVIGCWSQDDGP